MLCWLGFQKLGRMEDFGGRDCKSPSSTLPFFYLMGHPNRSSSLNDLAHAMSTRFRQSGSFDDLLDALAVKYFFLKPGMYYYQLGHPHQLTVESNLAYTLLIQCDYYLWIGRKTFAWWPWQRHLSCLERMRVLRVIIWLRWLAVAEDVKCDIWRGKRNIGLYPWLYPLEPLFTREGPGASICGGEL